MLGHVLYLAMNSKMLLNQEAATITNEQLILIMEAMFVTAGKYIDEAEHLLTKIKSDIESMSDSTKTWMERCCKLDIKYETELMAKNSKLEKSTLWHDFSTNP